ISSNNGALVAPTAVIVPKGSSTASFAVSAASAATGSIVLSAAFDGGTKAQLFTVSATMPTPTTVRLRDFSCTTTRLTPNSRTFCCLTLDNVNESDSVEIELSSSNELVQLPARLLTRAGQSEVEFQVDTLDHPAAAQEALITATLGTDIVRQPLNITRARLIRLPGPQYSIPGTEIRVPVLASDPTAQLSTDPLPAGATFDAASGEF